MNTLCGMSAVETTATNADAAFENLRLELRRGALVLAVLARLGTEYYGYALRKALVDQGMDIDENTLYPLLRRLETQGLLDSEWGEIEADRSASTALGGGGGGPGSTAGAVARPRRRDPPDHQGGSE